MSGAAGTRTRAGAMTENLERGGEVAGLIAEIVKRDAHARRAREGEARRRRVPVLLFLFVLLAGFGTWNFLRITQPAELPVVQAERAARAQLFLIASSLDRYRQDQGRLPSSLEEAGLDATGVEYRLEGGRYLLIVRAPTQVVLREGQDKTPFAAAFGIGGDS